jgi:hypothetical protein
MSASIAPTPPQIAPYIGPKIMAQRIMNASPKFTYPTAGIGIAIKYVATKISATNIAEREILYDLFFKLSSP